MGGASVKIIKKSRPGILTKTNLTLYAMFLPAIVYYVIFCYVPMAGIAIAFADFRPSGFIKWVGFENFEYLFNLPFFWRALANTFQFVFLDYLIDFPFPIILALLLNEVRVKFFKKTVQTITVLPHFLSWVVVSGIFISMLSPSTGFVNAVIKAVGGSPVYFLSKPEWFQMLVTLIRTWKGAGYSAIIYLAAISGIDQELYEAAVTDGAGRWKQAIHITLPGIRMVIVICLVLSFAGVLNLFDPVFVFSGDNALLTTTGEVLDTYIYKNGVVRAKYSVSTAAGLFKSVVSLGFMLTVNYISKKLSDENKAVI